MTQTPVSVVIVSRHRPEALARCLLGVSQLQYDPFEVVVVADPEGIKAATGMSFADDLKLIPFDEPNISAARNLGVVHAAGEVVAFIDDDAVPEPTWLHHLIAPAAKPEVAAMGGFVRGRNGISFQWRAQSLDALGEAHPLAVDATQTSVLHPAKGRAIKTEGTNMAFRRSVLVELGGFDPAYHYFLDETDLNMRLARHGHATAIVPLAEVHHGFAANALRTQARVPRNLFDIGASWAVLQRKYVSEHARAKQWAGLRENERRRALRYFVSGALEPRDVRNLMRGLDAGYAAGHERPLGAAQLPTHPAAPFMRFPTALGAHIWMTSRPMRLKQDLEAAAARVAQGEIVTVLCLSRTALYHKVGFTAQGVWLQKGGIFGRSERTEPLFRMTSRSRRIEKERARVARQRRLGKE